jgi:hypothetical protein
MAGQSGFSNVDEWLKALSAAVILWNGFLLSGAVTFALSMKWLPSRLLANRLSVTMPTPSTVFARWVR